MWRSVLEFLATLQAVCHFCTILYQFCRLRELYFPASFVKHQRTDSALSETLLVPSVAHCQKFPPAGLHRFHEQIKQILCRFQIDHEQLIMMTLLVDVRLVTPDRDSGPAARQASWHKFLQTLLNLHILRLQDGTEIMRIPFSIFSWDHVEIYRLLPE